MGLCGVVVFSVGAAGADLLTSPVNVVRVFDKKYWQAAAIVVLLATNNQKGQPHRLGFVWG